MAVIRRARPAGHPVPVIRRARPAVERPTPRARAQNMRGRRICKGAEHARAQDLQATDRLAGAQDMQGIDRLAGAQAYI